MQHARHDGARGPIRADQVDIGGSAHVWRKHWILFTILLVLAAIVSAGAVLKLPRTYQAQASVVLLSPQSISSQEGGNPYLNFTPSLTLTGDVLSRVVTGPVVVNSLAAEGYTASYSVALAPDTTVTTGSVLLITVTGGARANVERTLHAVMSETGRELAQLQQHVKAVNRIGIETISASPEATISISHTARTMAEAMAPVWLLALVIPILAERYSARRYLPEPAAPRHEQAPRSREAVLTGARARRDAEPWLEVAPDGRRRPARV